MKNRQKSMTREEQAAVEVGVTDISPRVARFLVICFLAVILIVPVIQHIHEIRLKARVSAADAERQGRLPQCYDIFRALPGPGEIAHKLFSDPLALLPAIEEIKDYETKLEEQSVVINALIPLAQRVLTGWFRVGNEKAYVGRDGWLFYRPSITYLTGPPFLEPAPQADHVLSVDEWRAGPGPDPVEALVDFGKQLSERGISLILLPAPAKPMIYPEKFSSRYRRQADGPLQNPSYRAFVDGLIKGSAEQGFRLEVVDAASLLFDEKVKDSRGSGTTELYLRTDTHWSPRAMRRVAAHLAQKIEGLGIPFEKDKTAPYPIREKRISNQGDIANMLNLTNPGSLFEPQDVVVEKVMTPDGSQWASDPASEILFLGDSYSNVYSAGEMKWGTGAGLIQHLSARLRRPIDTIVINDNSGYITRQTLAEQKMRGIDRLAGKKLVIWEFAIRELAVGHWPKIDLSPVEKRTDKAGIVVYVQSLRDNQLTDFSRVRNGAMLTLKLTPWAAAESAWGSIMRIDPEDPDLLYLDHFLGEHPPEAPGSSDLIIRGRVESMTRPPAPGSTPYRDCLSGTHLVDLEVVRGRFDPGEKRMDDSTDGRGAPALEPVTGPSDEAAVSAMVNDFIEEISGLVAAHENEGKGTVKGRKGWYFLRPELRSLSVGRFWGERARDVSRALKPDYADPLPAILDFKAQLDRAGIELILVPVPHKAVIYPDMLSDTAPAPSLANRLDPAFRAFYDLLAEKGVKVIDLMPHFLNLRFEDKVQAYCKQDSHWSSLASRLAAKLITAEIKDRSWLRNLGKEQFTVRRERLQFRGDLVRDLDRDETPDETLPVVVVERRDGGGTIRPDRDSPVLLLGDSHVLIFHAGGDMFSTGAGLADHLAYELGFPVDLIGVQGSGTTAARINLFMRKDNLAGKKVVIWCFSARFFVESRDGWRKVPLFKN